MIGNVLWAGDPSSAPQLQLPPAVGAPEVLVVEDDDDCLLVTTYTLELLGYQCLSTQNAQEVIHLARAHQPRLFLLDIAMPAVDGIEVLQQLRQVSEFRQCPIIAVTALAMDRDRDYILGSGFDDFLSKPFLLQDLAKLMQKHLPLANPSSAVDLQFLN